MVLGRRMIHLMVLGMLLLAGTVGLRAQEQEPSIGRHVFHKLPRGLWWNPCDGTGYIIGVYQFQRPGPVWERWGSIYEDGKVVRYYPEKGVFHWWQFSTLDTFITEFKRTGANTLYVFIYTGLDYYPNKTPGIFYPSKYIPMIPEARKLAKDPLRKIIDVCHKEGIEVAVTLGGLSDPYFSHTDTETQRRILYSGEKSTSPCLHSERYLARFKDIYREIVSSYPDLDVIQIDEPRYAGICCCELSKEAFRKWLREKVTAEEIRTMGLDDIKLPFPDPKFDINVWRGENPFLYNLWREFNEDSLGSFTKEIVQEIKKTNSTIKASLCLSPCGIAYTDWHEDWRKLVNLPGVDTVAADPYCADFKLPVQWMGLITRALVSLSEVPKPTYVVAGLYRFWWDYYLTFDEYQRSLIEPMINGADGIGIFSWVWLWRMDSDGIPADRKVPYSEYKEETFRIFNFLEKNKSCYTDSRLDDTTEIAMGFSYETVYSSAPYDYHIQQVWSIYHALLDSHIMTDVFFTPFQPSKLNKKKVLILQDIRLISDKDIQLIKDWVRKGNTLILIGANTLSYDEYGRRRPAISNEFKLAADHLSFTPYRKGHYIWLPKRLVGEAEDEGRAKIGRKKANTLTEFDFHEPEEKRQALAGMVTKGLSLAGGRLSLEIENCPVTVEANLLGKSTEPPEERTYFLHLLNHGEENVRDIKVLLRIPYPETVKGIHVNSLSGNFPNVPLDFTRKDGEISFTIPYLEKYSLIVIGR